MEYFVHVDGERLRVERSEGRITVNGTPIEVDLAPDGRTPVRSVLVDDRSLGVLPTRTGRGAWTLKMAGGRHEVQVLDRGQEAIRAARKAAGSGGPSPLKAPMPGLVIRVEVAEGDEVEEGQGLVIVEAMKMENELRAEQPARVTRVLAIEGEAVDKDQVLVEFEPLHDPEDDEEEEA